MECVSPSLLGDAKTLLLATDGSSFSDGAVQEALFFGQACHARVIVLHVVPTQVESISAANFAIRQGQQQLAPHLDRIRAMAREGGVEIEVVVVGSSRPEKTIVEQARLREADVIMMGRHGRAGRLSLLVGQMTAKVISQGFPRVLVAPKEFVLTGTHVLLAVNDSVNSRRVVEEGLSLGRRCTTLARITVLAVARREDERPRAQVLVEEVCARYRGTELKPECEPLVLIGDPAKTIAETAHERRVDMILVGGRSKGGLSRMFMGDVTKKVIGKSRCAVLVVTA